MAMGVVAEMGVDNGQSHFFYFIGSGKEQGLGRVAPLVDKGDDVPFLDDERVVVW